MDPNTQIWIAAGTLFLSGVMLGIDLQRRLARLEPRSPLTTFVNAALGLMALVQLLKLPTAYLQTVNALGLVLLTASAASWVRWWLRDQKAGFTATRRRLPFD